MSAAYSKKSVRARAYTHMCTHEHACAHTHMRAHTHMCAHVCAHTFTHTHMHTHTHAPAHTEKRVTHDVKDLSAVEPRPHSRASRVYGSLCPGISPPQMRSPRREASSRPAAGPERPPAGLCRSSKVEERSPEGPHRPARCGAKP